MDTHSASLLNEARVKIKEGRLQAILSFFLRNQTLGAFFDYDGLDRK